MGSHRVRYPRELATELLHLMAGRAPTSKGGPTAFDPPSLECREAPLPSQSALEQIFDFTYVTSLTNEEGRACLVTVAYVSPDDASELGHGSFRFSSPLPFDPAQLRKLAPATDPAVTSVAVWPLPDGALGIWGLLHQGGVKFSIDREVRPDFLQVRALRPGAFNVYCGGQTIALFVTDHWHVFESRLDLIGLLRGPLTDGNRAREFVRLARRMLSIGHGGTLLIVAKGHPISALSPHPAFTHPTAPAPLLKEAFDAHERFSHRKDTRRPDETEAQFLRRRRDAERTHADALDFVANLTAVDGALVMDDDLGVVGFGATIHTGTAPDPVVVLEDPRRPGSEAEVPASSIGGNRHRSAVLFCMQQEGLALALVASQDGDLSLVGRKDDGRAHVIRPFELGEGL